MSKVLPKDLKAYCEDPANQDNKKIVISVFSSEYLSRHRDGKAFDKGALVLVFIQEIVPKVMLR